MSGPEFDVIVIGGGVVGLSIGYYCAESGFTTAVLERHERFCEEASTHNSGVIHSGFNPEPGTLKAALNTVGLKLIRKMAAEWNYKVKQTGTLVAAISESQSRRLRVMKAAGESNGVKGIRIVSQSEIKDIEPAIEGAVSGLYSPEGGVIDIMEYIARLQAHASMSGVVLAPKNEVIAMSGTKSSLSLTLSTGEVISSRYVVNSAGLHADDVASMLGSTYRLYPCVGEYAYVVGDCKNLIRGMVYPVVEEGFPGLGTHLTRTIDGQLQVGPTAVYGKGKDPTVWERTPLSDFLGAVRIFLPNVSLSDMHEGWFGIRAKTVGPGSGKSYGDFVVEWDRHGYTAIHLVGIESPGFTSSLALGRYVADMLVSRTHA